MQKDQVNFIVGLTAGLLIGGSTTYLVVKKRVEKKYREIADQEIESVKETYDLLAGKGKFSDPKEAFKEYNKRIDFLQYGQQEQAEDEEAAEVEERIVVEETETTTSSNAGQVSEETLRILKEHMEGGKNVKSVDISAEHRTPNKPYLITLAEFMENDDNDHITVTYYPDDNTLVDDGDEVIPDIDKVIGEKNLARFGDGSENDNVVYVRNEKLHSDFEVLRENGSYEEIVLGITRE